MTENITNIPFDKHSFPESALNSGKVKLTVKINNTVPFTKASRVDDALIFNSQSMAGFSQDLLDKVSYVPGTEGIFLRPEINYRHNFVMGFKYDDESKSLQRDYVPDAIIFNDVNPEPLYKEEFTWVIKSGFYNNRTLSPSEYNTIKKPNDEEGCPPCAIWKYATLNKSVKITDKDTSAVGKIFNRFIESFAKSPYMQYPAQVASDSTNASGVHWRLEKLTPTFEGMDIFFEFTKVARSTSLAGEKLDWIQKRYLCLNAYEEGGIKKRFSGQTVPSNLGVANYSNDEGVWQRNDEDFYKLDRQAYYVIELGVGDPDNNYFLFITENGPIRLVRIKDGISWVVSQYGGGVVFDNVDASDSKNTTGAFLINSDTFRVEIRNHLGKMIIRFVSPGLQAEPWVITRIDQVDTGLRSEDETKEKVVPARVPRGKVSIWGGNLLTSFFYGPIQYAQPSATKGASLSLPSSPAEAFGITTETTDNEGRLVDNTFALPLYSDHSLTFSTSDSTPEVNIGEKKPRRIRRREQQPYYTCDAHQVTEMIGGKYSTKDIYFQNAYDIKERGEYDLSDRIGTVPSRLTVRKTHTKNDEATLNETFRLQIGMRAGNHIFRNNGNVWELQRCKTPVLNILKLKSEPKNISRWSKDSIDVTDHVLAFNESWSTSDYKQIEHTGTISFLLNPGAIYAEDRTEELESLRNKAFYIEIWGGYEDCNYSDLPSEFKLFTGICFGGKLNKEIGKRTLDCQIYDYNVILKDSLLFNSPFFDGVIDSVAIDEILRLAGFKYQDKDDPGYFIHSAAEAMLNDEIYKTIGNDGRWIETKKWSLPQAYGIIEQPAFKFGEATPMLDGITTITKKSGKVFFFDAHGQAHYENYQDTLFEILTGQRSANPLFSFTTDPATFQGQMIFNAVSVEHDVSSVYNHVRVMTNTPGIGESGSQAPVFGDEIDWSSVHDPNKEGFLGYLRTVYQEEGLFGSEEALRDLVDYYKSFRRPPYVVNFETYGQPIRALDIVQLNNQPLRVVRVDSQFDPTQNVWWQKFECEWFQPIIEND